MPRNLRFAVPIFVGALLFTTAALMWPRPASAQCGSQASSCRNCHEVQGQDAVNAKGDWHVQHAFGDFCEFCHAGNVQAADKAAAHTGMIEPLGDVKANCASCHPNDYTELAQGYATALGLTLEAGSGPASGGENVGATPSVNQPTTAAPAPEAPSAQQLGVVDFNAQYAASHTGAPINWGNVVLGVSLAALVIGGAAFVVWRERGLRGQIPSPKSQTPKQETSVVSQQSSVGNDRSSVSDPPGLRPEVAELLPALQALEPRALKALKKILAEPSTGSELLIALSHIDPVLIEQVRRLDRRELNLLMALAGEG